MSKRISFKKLGEKVEKSKNEGSMAGPTLTKRVVIGKKRLREDLTSSPSKKGKDVNSPREKRPPLRSRPKTR